MKQFFKLIDQKNNKFILVYKDNWHHGVLGIVASKIASIYNKPTFIFLL